MAPLNVRAARLGVVEDERHGLELDDQGQTERDLRRHGTED